MAPKRGLHWLGAQVSKPQLVFESFKVLASQKDFEPWNHFEEEDKIRKIKEIWTESNEWTCGDLQEQNLVIPVYSPWSPNNYTTGYTGWGAGPFKGSDVHITALAKRLIDAEWSEEDVAVLWDRGINNASHLAVMPYWSGKVGMLEN